MASGRWGWLAFTLKKYKSKNQGVQGNRIRLKKCNLVFDGENSLVGREFRDLYIIFEKLD